MQNLKMLVAAMTLAGLSSLPLTAQQPATQEQTSPNPQAVPAQPGTTAQPSPAGQSSAPAVPVQSTANAPEVQNPQLRPVKGELQTKIDSKKAKPGDPIVVKTTEKATTADGVEIPKGSKIMGHITDVQPHDKNNENAKVTLQFDKAELKGGQALPIKSVLESVSATSGGQPEAMGGGAPAPMASAPGGGPSGGGSSSGMAGSPSASQPAPTQSGAMASAPSGAQPASNGPAAGTVVAQQGNTAIKTTGIPGVLLASSVNGQPFANAAGALLGAKQNVHLDGGTEMVVAIAQVPSQGGR